MRLGVVENIHKIFNNDVKHSFRRPKCHIVMQCGNWVRNSRKPVPYVTLLDLGTINTDREESFGYLWPHAPKCEEVHQKLFQQVGVSYGTTHTALKKRLCLRRYKIRAVHELKPDGSAKWVAYCKWFLDFIDREGEDILDVIIFTDEAYSHLSGYINSQNSRVWCAHNSHAFRESQLHDEKVSVSVGMSRRLIVGPFFFQRLSTPNGTVTVLCIPSLRNWKKVKLTRPTFSRIALRLIQRVCLWHSWTTCLRTVPFVKPFGHQDFRIFLRPICFSGVRWKTHYIRTIPT